MALTDGDKGVLFWRDEILQILYWLRGEGLGDSVTPQDVVVFLDADPARVDGYLRQLAEDRYVERQDGDPARYRLTDLGLREGGRRFADEFAGLTGQAHMECNDPNCVCKTEGPEACESHSHRG